MEPSSPADFVVPCESESLHLFHSLSPKKRLQFHCYEMLLMQRLERDAVLYNDLCETFGECEECNRSSSTSRSGVGKARARRRVEFLSKHRNKIVSDDLWFLHVTLQQAKDKLASFLRREVDGRRRRGRTRRSRPSAKDECPIDAVLREDEEEVDKGVLGIAKGDGESLLARYLRSFNFVELHLDSITSSYAGEKLLPRALFKHCPNVTVLSLRSNYIRSIPPDIGRLKRLRRLCLTNNNLQNGSIPPTLTFCSELSELYVDNNLLDALPGFLLRMPSLNTVHRHGNHNYFKATFMWYHTDVNERILKAPGVDKEDDDDSDEEDAGPPEPKKVSCSTLQYLCMKSIVATRKDFFSAPSIPPTLKDTLSDLFEGLNLCGNCPAIRPVSEAGYKVYTFKNPYLGNTCVPFLHWACSLDCARDIEVPARLEQLQSAEEQDRIYRQYVLEAMRSSVNSGGAGSNASAASPSHGNACLAARNRSPNGSCESVNFARRTSDGEGGGSDYCAIL